MPSRASLLLALVVGSTCNFASAQDVLGQARLRVYLLSTYTVIAEKACVEKYSDLKVPLALARSEFQQKLTVDVELGKEFGKALVAKRGEDIGKLAERLAWQDLEKFVATPHQGFRQLCDDLVRETKSRAYWSINDYLREDFETHMMAVGNRQALPCSFIPLRLKGIASRFINRGHQTTEPDLVLDQLFYLEVLDLSEKVSNCLAGQARATEYRVVPGVELQTISGIVNSLQSALMPYRESSTEKTEVMRVAKERATEFLREQEGK